MTCQHCGHETQQLSCPRCAGQIEPRRSFSSFCAEIEITTFSDPVPKFIPGFVEHCVDLHGQTTCDYCGRLNHSGTTNCLGCGAGLPEEDLVARKALGSFSRLLQRKA